MLVYQSVPALLWFIRVTSGHQAAWTLRFVTVTSDASGIRKARYLFREMWLWTERDLALYAVVGLFLLEVYVAWTHGVWCMIAIPKHPATVAKKIMILFPVRYEPEKKARCGGLAFSTDPRVMTKRPGKAGYHDDMTGTDPTFDIPIIRLLTLV